jgi:hypothetical protein
MSDSGKKKGCGCGCVSTVALFLLVWWIAVGIPVDGRKWNLDLFPPRIWDVNQERPAEPEAAPEEDGTPERPAEAAPANPEGGEENEKREGDW